MAFFGDLVEKDQFSNTDAWARLSDSTLFTVSSHDFAYDCQGRLRPKLGYTSIWFDLPQKSYGAMLGTRDQRA